MKRILFLLLLLFMLTECKKPEFQARDILVTGTARPVISLDGRWKFTMSPPEGFFLNSASSDSWNDIMVPGECAMQGYAIRHNVPFVYKTKVMIPEDYLNKKIKLRFEGVYSFARVWVNGAFIRDHSGGFTPWECDITQAVVPGSEAWITVEVTDRDDDLSYGSGYAKHQIGGILRSVSLLALPDNFPSSVKIFTGFDRRYRDADLRIRITRGSGKPVWAGFRMFDRNGSQVRLSDRRYRVSKDTSDFVFKVKTPFKWDAENPNLYTLIVEIFDESILTASWKTRFGFREAKAEGNRLLVNGEEVKLRGACRHDIHPLLGRVSTPEYDKTDVLLAKEANMNLIRTSHYPPSESFLRYCDEYGIYVEDESAVCFVNTHRNRFYKDLRQSGPEFIAQQMSQVEEMVQNHFNHPSVIIWSLGNESLYNEGFRMGYDYIKSVDTTRPVIFSYPGSVPDSIRCYDILSMHYPSWKGSLIQWGMKTEKFGNDKIPVLFDEWAHVPCYNKPELAEDMNVRDFWGLSIDSMWTYLFSSGGGAGGAIWGMIDETFMLPDTMSGYNDWWGIQEESNGIRMYEGPAVGYGEWGIVDTWRRKKPEFWHVKKAYSPVRINVREITGFRAGSALAITVHNRFSHTNLRDVKTTWTYMGKTYNERLRNIPPGRTGEIQLPPAQWRNGEMITLRFWLNDSVMIDEHRIRLGKSAVIMPSGEPGEVKVTESMSGDLLIETKNYIAGFDASSGLLRNVRSGNDTLIISGPWFNYRYPNADHWSVINFESHPDRIIPEKINHGRTDGGAYEINVSGRIRELKCDYSTRIYADGLIETTFSAEGFPSDKKAQEYGLRFETGRILDSLSWKRMAYWSSYPVNHQGADTGNAELDAYNPKTYRHKPSGDWSYDNMSFYYDGLVRRDNPPYVATSMKENILSYKLSGRGHNVEVISSGVHACRLKKSGRNTSLFISNHWDYLSLNWGNYTRNKSLPRQLSDTVRIRVY